MGRRVRSTRRRQDAPDLPRVPLEDRTVGRGVPPPRTAGEYRPSMFLTVTLPSYGPVSPCRVHLGIRAAMTIGGRRWMRCTSRSWSTGSGRTCAAAPATGCSTSPPSNPNDASPRTCTPPSAAPSPARCCGQVVAATYLQLWWPPLRPARLCRPAARSGPASDYVDPDTGEVLPTWEQALDRLDARPGRAAGACAAVRRAAGHGRHHRPLARTPTGPSAT